MPEVMGQAHNLSQWEAKVGGLPCIWDPDDILYKSPKGKSKANQAGVVVVVVGFVFHHSDFGNLVLQ